MRNDNDSMVEDIVEIFDEWFDAKMRNIHTILPGKIVEYDYQERKAKVKPLVKMKLADNSNVSIEPIDNVPVVFMGTKNCRIHFPLKKDDGVLLLFAESPIGNFLSSDSEQESDDFRRFNLADCIAIPGLWSFNTVPDKPDNGDDFFIIFQDTTISIKDKTNLFKIEDKNGCVIESTSSSSVKINENFEVSQ